MPKQLLTDELFRALLESAPDAMVIADGDGRIVLVNAQTLRMFGYERDELIGQSIEILVPERFRDVHPYHRRNYFAEPRTRPMGEGIALFGRRKTGEDFAVEISLAPIETEGGVLVASAIRDTTERRKIQNAIAASLREKEILLREVHHRVKNNLQIVISLLSLQSEGFSDPIALAAIRESQTRVRAMALVHEMLYRTGDFEGIDLGTYVRSVVDHLLRSFGAAARVEAIFEVDPINLALDIAVPCGLVVHEVVTNSLKHGFEAGQEGTINISFVQDNGRCRLTIRDDGVGMPDDGNPPRSGSLGLRLIHMLTRELRGESSFHNDGGAVFELSFATPQGATPPTGSTVASATGSA